MRSIVMHVILYILKNHLLNTMKIEAIPSKLSYNVNAIFVYKALQGVSRL